MIYDVIIIGAGAAGLMAAVQAGKCGRSVLLIEHTLKIGEKIRISGGGRCNFTNLYTSPERFICKNPHFVKSALSSYTQHDFIKLIEEHKIDYHEKTLGQLFCDGSSKQIINMLVELCARYHVEIKLGCNVGEVTKNDLFSVGDFQGKNLIIATGGLSIPQIGASDFGYRIAKQFGHKIIPTKPALVPLTVSQKFTELSGVSNFSKVSYKKASFDENILFTHRGLSGPAILQISSYLESFKKEIMIDLLPLNNLEIEFLRDKNSKQLLSNYLKNLLPNRLVDFLSLDNPEFQKTLTDLKKEHLIFVAAKIHNFKVMIEGSEGYQKAEVTVGGVDTNELSSKTMESKKVPGLFFIGEAVDVTGWLGGYNFQWAWSSGFVAGNNVSFHQ